MSQNSDFYNGTRDYSPGVPPDGSVCNVHSCNATTHSLAEQDPERYRGHLDYFGRQGQPDPGIDIVEGCIPGPEFLERYVYRHKPVLMRGCGWEMPALERWTDEYFSATPELREWTPIVETQKTISRNDRGPHIFNMTFEEFLGRYRSDPYYVINGVEPERLRRDIQFPSSMRCLRTLRQIDEVHMWFSSGGTESSQHFDTHDNILFMIDGTKEVLLTDPIHSFGLYMDYHDKFGLSPINVRHVDLTVFPLIAEIPVINVTINKGDGLYIPTHWWHQVNSDKSDVRNIGLSMGWHGGQAVGSVHPETGYKLHGLKEFDRGLEDSGIFSKNLIDWASRYRTEREKQNVSRDDICGGFLEQGVTLADIPQHDDAFWYSYGVARWELRDWKDLFTGRLKAASATITVAVEEGLDIRWSGSDLCNLSYVFSSNNESVWVDMTQKKGPVVELVSNSDPRLVHGDVFVYAKSPDRFLDYLNTPWPEKETLQFEMIRKNEIKMVLNPRVSPTSETSARFSAFRTVERCLSAIFRSGNHAQWLLDKRYGVSGWMQKPRRKAEDEQAVKPSGMNATTGNRFTALNPYYVRYTPPTRPRSKVPAPSPRGGLR